MGRLHHQSRMNERNLMMDIFKIKSLPKSQFIPDISLSFQWNTEGWSSSGD